MVTLWAEEATNARRASPGGSIFRGIPPPMPRYAQSWSLLLLLYSRAIPIVVVKKGPRNPSIVHRLASEQRGGGRDRWAAARDGN